MPSEADSHATELPEDRYVPPPDETDSLPEVEGLITLPLDAPESEESLQDTGIEGDPRDGEMQSEDGSAELPPDPGQDEWDEEAQSLLDKLKQAFSNMLETLDMASVESADAEEGREQGSGASEESSASGNPADTGEPDSELSSETADATMEGGEPGETADETASAGSTSGEDSDGDTSSGGKRLCRRHERWLEGTRGSGATGSLRGTRGAIHAARRDNERGRDDRDAIGRADCQRAVQSAFHQPHGPRQRDQP